MTRKQAIIRLNRISNSLSRYCDVNDCIRGNCAKCYDALNIAIEALEQEPIIHCKDCKHWHEWENGTGALPQEQQYMGRD